MTLQGVPIGFALAAILGVASVGTSTSFAQVVPRTVLTVHYGAESHPSNPILDAGIRDTLASRPDVPVDYFAEYLESEQFPAEEATGALRDSISRKFRGRRIDLVIALADPPLRMVLNHRHELFADAPIVFSALAPPDDPVRRAGAGLTGIKVGIAYAETLRLALQLHPSTERVYVVANGRDPRTVALVRAELAPLSQQVAIIHLNEETVPGLLAAIRAIPPRSLVLYIWQSQQDAGQVVYPDAIARLVAKASPVPVYGTSDFYIGTGVVGGVVRGTRETGVRIGQMALRILTGTRAQDIPIEFARVAPVLDWRQLQRWNISEASLPAGAVVRFHEPSVWERYRVYILGAVLVLLAQMALIAGLLIQRAGRRQAEEQVRGSQAQLRTSYEQVRDLGARLLNAQETERARIARELHDDVGQQVASLEIDLDLLRGTVAQETEELAEGALNRAHQIARTVHDLSHQLHPAKLRLIGLVAALHGLERELSQSGVTITLTHDNVPPALPHDFTLCVFRVVQEGLQNALKYSGARAVSVQLAGSTDRLVVTIADEGIGFDLAAVWGKGLGLISMGERVEAMGGSLEIRSQRGAGTRVDAVLPLPIAHESATVAV